MRSEATGPTISLERDLPATPSRVFELLCRPESIPKWLGPSDEFRVTAHEWDCRPGGRYRVEFNAPDGETNVVVGEFREVVKDKRLAFTWTWEGKPVIDSLVTLQLKAAGEGTHLQLTHTGFPDVEMRDHHNFGWIGTLDRLGRACE
ncbi:MAG: SRPBCC domain-containing protein [Planctomycetota bacterium]